jgi:hypothetical protein
MSDETKQKMSIARKKYWDNIKDMEYNYDNERI